jgi:hypothetical protein
LVLSGGEIFDVSYESGSAIVKIDALPAPISAMVYRDGQLFGVGNYGSIVEMDSLNFLRVSQAAGRIHLDAVGLAGRRVRIDSSQDMLNWTEGSTVLTLPVLNLEAPDSSSAGQRFYRATPLD